MDYRFAPEAPFPAAINDSISVLLWTDANRAELANADAPLFVCGDSSGGNLAAAVSIINRDKLDVDLAGQILIYPSVDGNLDYPDFDAFDAPILKKEEILWFRRQFASKQDDRRDPRVSPIDTESHANLPPALILTAEFDLLNAQATAYARKLTEAAVPVEHRNFKGAVHGFFTDGVGLHQSNEAMTDINSFISRGLAHLEDSMTHCQRRGIQHTGNG